MPQNWPSEDAFFPICTPFIKQWEGLRLAPYLDSVGVPTIGWGTIRYPDGRAVTMTDPEIDESFAETCLRHEMAEKSAGLSQTLARMPSAHQAGAMLSLTYNIGLPAFRSSTVLKRFNAGDIAGAAEAFLMWNKGHVDGALVEIRGLTNRRNSEKAFFLSAD